MERRTDPRRGVVLRVGLTLTATGIASAAVDRRSLAGVAADVPLAVGFGLFIPMLLPATLPRPPRGATWPPFASVSLIYLLPAPQRATRLIRMLSYPLLPLPAPLRTAP